ncbi:replication factor C large subunit [Candidatus Woesearchaeota archaeon]|jgi:replication factor C large subunit|nr:replication factor C large subunit [Candidatus Woesearchaeota archaeon]MBT4368605.1 replication factor C large subunit [Candidatus Woesearchaeota archaeon]MBT4713086.1 replication factor C large subunit [Candidatus Woesearchaeota archaeon]MBT6639008.1 replication factor C large subunit [Candidatus Woesearchaeota archaeon]MBT7134207.1 replication factor C large subunit [Candidatus Woesearchaeota archaeon]
MNYTDKYLPKTSAEVVGQDLKGLKEFVSNFKKGKAAFVYGPVGCGKTSAIYAIAAESEMEVFEVNASDARNKSQIEDIVGSATQQQSLFSFNKGKIVLIDEVDGISGQKDRGGVTALVKLIIDSPFPMIITANDPFDKKFSGLRKKCTLLEFNTLDHEAILNKLKHICENEGIEYKEELLSDLARRSGGDLRAAINDLQMLTGEGKLDNLELIGFRDKTENMLNALLKVFKTTDANVANSAFWNVNEDIDKQMLWLEENIPREYKGKDIANAFDCLSKASVYMGRIRRWQHWRFLVYAGTLMSAGVALSKKEKYKEMITYKPTSRILKIWMANMKYQKRKEIARKIAEKTHTSAKRVISDVLPYVQTMIKKGKEFREFDLSEEEITWLRK